jgi:flagellar hook-basal body complex protein FliE
MASIKGLGTGITTPGVVIKGPQEVKGGAFADTLKDFTRYVDGELQKADQIKQEFAVGKRADLHEVMIASEKADLSFRLLLQMRNKMLEAYQEIMRMQF